MISSSESRGSDIMANALLLITKQRVGHDAKCVSNSSCMLSQRIGSDALNSVIRFWAHWIRSAMVV